MKRLLGIGCAGLLLLAAPATALQPAQPIPAIGTIEYAFTPNGNAAGLIIRTIHDAREAIYVQAFSFTHTGIARALIDAQARGVRVEVLADASQIEHIEHNVIPMLVAGKIAVLVDAEHSSAHDKVIIVDPESEWPAVVTGSFNFTFAAQYHNGENVLVLHGNRQLAHAYLRNWQRHRVHSRPYRATGARHR